MSITVDSRKFNIYNWLLQRISGIVLLLLLGLHLLRMHGYSQDSLVYKALLQHISSSAWKVFDMSFLVLVVYHGMYGTYSITRDYINKQVYVRIIIAVLIIIGLAALVKGYVIVFWQHL